MGAAARRVAARVAHGRVVRRAGDEVPARRRLSYYTHRAFGAFAGFLIGFCMLAAGIVSVGALALGFAGDYLTEFVDAPVPLTATVFLFALAALNARGIKESMGANAVATIIEVSGLLLIVALGAWMVARSDTDLSRLTQLGTPTEGP